MAVSSNPQVCPFLGFYNDPDTCHTMPSRRHCCHRVQPAFHITLEHQTLFCITPGFASCPVYQEPEDTQLPRTIHARRLWDRLVGARRVALGVLVVALIIALIVLLR